MYHRILIAIENSGADRTVLDHVERLAKLCGASLLLVHVADGWVARHYDELALRESEEMKEDRAYLEKIQAELESHGFMTRAHLAMGDPATELVRVAAGRARRSDRDVDPRPSPPQRHHPRQHGGSRPPQRVDSRPDDQGPRRRRLVAAATAWRRRWDAGRSRVEVLLDHLEQRVR